MHATGWWWWWSIGKSRHLPWPGFDGQGGDDTNVERRSSVTTGRPRQQSESGRIWIRTRGNEPLVIDARRHMALFQRNSAAASEASHSRDLETHHWLHGQRESQKLTIIMRHTIGHYKLCPTHLGHSRSGAVFLALSLSRPNALSYHKGITKKTRARQLLNAL